MTGFLPTTWSQCSQWWILSRQAGTQKGMNWQPHHVHQQAQGIQPRAQMVMQEIHGAGPQQSSSIFVMPSLSQWMHLQRTETEPKATVCEYGTAATGATPSTTATGMGATDMVQT
eukprot:CAMPEP_0174715474 /NCGR_PEP_ID=MMETSP1094-20130205/21239_1 /TAXON_ID=156173 /ORGANISM="Chrysochromulina brevifilum, Strain UTEX LB 985" /LENGTH=114 /DNA_ID=CAMNT_0015915049 /DNA_START=273 /DNA_END=617 /DNA_ORIENTATION=-